MALDNDRLRVIALPIINDAVERCRADAGITAVGHAYHRVRYVPAKIFHVDSFLESALFPDKVAETFRNMLLTKTKKWEQEEEIRFIGRMQNVNLIFDGYVSEVTFGPGVPDEIFEKLEAAIAGHCRANGIRISRLS